MSTSKGSAAAAGGVQPIPAGSRKMVQSLKEIVSCSESEIYATLKDCNMDPNEAVSRLLFQDPFHEVKRKKEKKKDGKDTTEFRARGANNSSNRGAKSGGADRYLGRGSSTPYYSTDSAPFHGRSTYNKENGSSNTSSLSSATGMSGTNRGGGPPGLSDSASAEYKGSLLGNKDGLPFSSQSPSTYHSAWAGVPGQVSMADIVKMGRPQNIVTNVVNASRNKVQGPSTTTSEQVSIKDEWPSIEKPAASIEIIVPKYNSEVHHEASLAFDTVHPDSEEEEDQETEEDDIEDSEAIDVASAYVSTRMMPNDDSRGASFYESDFNENRGSYQQQAHDIKHHEEVGVSVTSVTRNLQQLSVEKAGDESPSEGDVPSVVIPNHLQVQTADCSHLSFGSFGSVMNVAHSSGSMASVPAKTNLEERDRDADILSVEHPDSRNFEYYVDDSLRTVSDGSVFHRTGTTAGSSSALQPEELKPENTEVSHADRYSFPSSNSVYSIDNAKHLNAGFSQTNSEMQNLAQFSTVMQSYPDSRPSNLLAANAHPSRESELQYSQFPMAQSVPEKYGNSVSSIGGSTISISEALKNAPQAQSGANIATGPPLPQHLALHPYSQPTLPLGQFANMIGYPFLPQSYTYMPSAFQQAFAGNNAYHQSLAAVLPQYKSSISVSSMPQSASIASGYGGFGSNASIPANFSMNQPAAPPSGSNFSYDDVLSSQYKDNNHLISLQQNENPAIWMHSPNSGTMSAVPASTYYNNYQQGQNQQPGGFRQTQQPSQNYYGAYPNFYHSQVGMSLDQPQNPRDSSLGGAQGQPKQSQIWQNGY